jgi:hypothetical protein
MLVLHDKNQTLEPPEGFDLQSVKARGEYLIVEYRRTDSRTEHGGSDSTVAIYLNSMGREVLRTTNRITWMHPLIRRPVVSVSRWFRIKNGFYLALAGLGEMLQCLKR